MSQIVFGGKNTSLVMNQNTNMKRKVSQIKRLHQMVSEYDLESEDKMLLIWIESQILCHEKKYEGCLKKIHIVQEHFFAKNVQNYEFGFILLCTKALCYGKLGDKKKMKRVL